MSAAAKAESHRNYKLQLVIVQTATTRQLRCWWWQTELFHIEIHQVTDFLTVLTRLW